MDDVRQAPAEMRAMGGGAGLNTPRLRALAKRLGRDQALAEELWETGISGARVPATFCGGPRRPGDFDSWRVRDAGCFPFDCTPHDVAEDPQMGRGRRRVRAAFATPAAIAVHGALPPIEHYAFDDRNFVRNRVNQALRNIGKRNAALLPAAIECARRIRTQKHMGRKVDCGPCVFGSD